AMTATALLLLEASLWMEEGAHVITISSKLLGNWGKAVSWVLYLFIGYASLVAYTAGGGDQMINAIQHHTGFSLNKEWGAAIFIILFGIVIDMGSAVVGRVNTILFSGMIIAYLLLVGMGSTHIK